MSPELIVLPILAMISGIASLFIDSQDSRFRWSKPFLLTLIILTALATIFFGYQNQVESRKKELENANEIKALREENKTLRQEIRDTPERTVRLLLFGYTNQSISLATREQVVQSEQANIQLKSAQKTERQEIERRKLVTVQYFPKNVDPEVIRLTLEQLGFNLQIKQPKVLDIPTNALWFGSNVNLEDVKLVAYTLIRAGVKIKTIKPFRGNPGEPWASLIQVGADGDYVNSPVLSVDEIRQATRFVRN